MSLIRPGDPNLETILTKAANTGAFLHDGEWLISFHHPDHTSAMAAAAAYHGYLPMYEKSQRLLLLKLHQSRCMLRPGAVHIGRQVKKKAAQFRLSVDEAFREVVKATQEHTFTEQLGDCWLADEMAESYRRVNDLPERERRGVSFHSVELWHIESGRLVAGEIGYTVGSIYSSATGFARKKEFPGVGILQLAALGKLLERCGFTIWDLGMELDYKKEMGGEMQPRRTWLDHVRKLRDVPVVLKSPDVGLSAKELVAAAPEKPDDEKDAAQS